LLPLGLVGFIGALAEAAKSCILWRDCCLYAWQVSWDEWRRQQNPASKAHLLPLRLASFIGASAVAADIKLYEEHCCLWDKFIL
jgi:hypothetical protein